MEYQMKDLSRWKKLLASSLALDGRSGEENGLNHPTRVYAEALKRTGATSKSSTPHAPLLMPATSIGKSHKFSPLAPRRPRLAPLRTGGPKQYKSHPPPFQKLRRG